ncbi:MAG: hypothetical protein ACOH19_01955 [Rhodoglobus sp.]
MFLVLGVTLSITLQNIAMGLPFLVLAIVYVAMGINAVKKTEGTEPESPEQ